MEQRDKRRASLSRLNQKKRDEEASPAEQYTSAEVASSSSQSDMMKSSYSSHNTSPVGYSNHQSHSSSLYSSGRSSSSSSSSSSSFQNDMRDEISIRKYESMKTMKADIDTRSHSSVKEHGNSALITSNNSNRVKTSLVPRMEPIARTINSNSGSYQAVEKASSAVATSVIREPVVKWICNICENECIPIIRESRCLCGHRLKDHPAKRKKNLTPDQVTANAADSYTFPCSNKTCKCTAFMYIVAEGVWILRCRCKHKHTEHNCESTPHYCQKCAQPGSGPASTRKTGRICTGFDSPWVCNCGHVWGDHTQVTVHVDRAGSQAAAEALRSGYANDAYSSSAPAPVLDHINLPPAVGGNVATAPPKASSKEFSRKQFALRQDGY